MKDAVTDNLAANVQQTIDQMVIAKRHIKLAKAMGGSSLSQESVYNQSLVRLKQQIEGLKAEGYTFLRESEL